MPNRDRGTFKILIVEDNEGDVRLIKEALNEAKILNAPFVVRDGVQAMNFLHNKGEYAKAPQPDLIILDLNLPLKDGRQVLAEIKTDNDLKLIPVVIFTTSQAEEDLIKTYSLHANCYITKPLDFNKFIKIIQSIEDFWFTVVKLPPAEF
jgi:chemotaxis family two-component system response regulator Rcp1